jgi:hypothetical protein
MFCAPGPIFGGAEAVRSLFNVLRARNHFRLFRGRRVPFSRFALPDSFLMVLRVSGTVLTFCAPRLVFGRTEGVGYCFHVIRARTHFQRYRGRRVPFSCFARTNLFSAVPRASCPVFMFCAPGLNFGGTEGVGFLFHVLPSRTCFWRYRGRPIPFSCFARPDSFSAVQRASGPVFMSCVPRAHFRRY